MSKEKQIGDYILEDEIGSGGFAKVVQGIHIPTGEKVAIKVLDKLQLMEDPENLKRVEREIQILKLVKHKNIIKLYEVMETPQKIYLVMELCEGGELFDYIVSKERLDENQACHFFQEIINALDYLHSQNIVHRDIKPENMLLDKIKDKISIKIIDFGISTSYTNEALLSTPCGTATYAPPEMHKGEEYYGLLSDVWSSGVVLYAMVYGYLPFCEEDEDVNIKNIIAGDYELAEEVSEDVRDLIKHCMDIDPLERYDLDQIKQHKWFNMVTPPSLRPGVIVGYNKIPIDERIVKLCAEFGYEQDKIYNSVVNNKYDRNSAVYYIMLKKLIKEGYDSVSDLKSEDFVSFINSEDNLLIKKSKEEINKELNEIPKKEEVPVTSEQKEEDNKEESTNEEKNKEREEEKDNIDKDALQQRKLISKYAGRKSLSLQSQLHLTLINEIANKAKKRFSVVGIIEDGTKDKILQTKNPRNSLSIHQEDNDKKSESSLSSPKSSNKEEPKIEQPKKDHTIIHNRNASCVEISKDKLEEKLREISSSPAKQSKSNKKPKVDKAPWKYKRMALERINENTKYSEYKRKMQQSLAVKAIHNNYNTMSKVLNKTQLNNTVLNNTIINNEKQSNNTSMSVSFYINNSMLYKETESSAKKKHYKTIANSAHPVNKGQKCSKAEEEEEIHVRTIKKPFKKISQYIEKNLLSPQKKKYLIPKAMYSSACKIKTRTKKVYSNDEMNPREFPRKIKEGPIDISCIKDGQLKTIWDNLIKWFKSNKITFMKVTSYKFHCSKNGGSFNVEICSLGVKTGLYYLSIKSKDYNDIINTVIDI